jgi:FkbM family methyltransferase
MVNQATNIDSADRGLPQHIGSTIHNSIRKWLGRGGIYQRAKDSWIYDSYWSVANRKIIDDRRREVEFYRNLLNGFHGGDLIFDIGANEGYKTGIFLRLGARVVSVEPDKTNQEILKQRFLQYRVKRKPLVIVPKAVSDRSSTERMWIDTPGSAMNTLSQKWAEILRRDNGRFGQRLSFGKWEEVETVSMEKLIIEYGLPFFVKVDVEGHELSVLRGMKRPVPYLSFEINLPEFRPEGLECVQILAGLARDGIFNYATDCRQGVVLKRWLRIEEFPAILDSCTDKSIEVFWKTPISRI